MSRKKIIVDPTKPLPTELSKEFWETAAKIILEKFFPERFVDLSVEGERPDLRNATVGIEVTDATNRETQEIDSLYSRPYAYGNDKQKKSALKRIEELGGRAGEYCLVHPGRCRDLNRIYERIRNKINKLNDDYEIFSKNYLFVYTDELIIDQELEEVLQSITKSSEGRGVQFDSVFLYRFGSDLYEFDIKNRRYLHINNCAETVQQLVLDARAIMNAKYPPDKTALGIN